MLAGVSAELDAVEAALQRLDSGQFGKCEQCGGQIEPGRLEADPIAVRCATHDLEVPAL